MNYSITIGGIIAALALPALAQWGFSEACSQQILGIGIPTLLSIPGLLTAYFGRLRAGGVTFAGFRK